MTVSQCYSAKSLQRKGSTLGSSGIVFRNTPLKQIDFHNLCEYVLETGKLLRCWCHCNALVCCLATLGRCLVDRLNVSSLRLHSSLNSSSRPVSRKASSTSSPVPGQTSASGWRTTLTSGSSALLVLRRSESKL